MARIEIFANPHRFMSITRPVRPWVGWACALVMGYGLWVGLFDSPPDYQQGETVRIMYVHVPAAWMALFCYVFMAASAAVALIWHHPLGHVVVRATAPVGAVFAFITLVTGSLWGKPMWGTWWVWDARLTSMLVLFFLYLGYMALADAFDDRSRGDRSGAVLLLIGVINVPVIKFSVDWWYSLHQPASVLRLDGPSIHADMLWPLLLMAVGYMLLWLWLLLLRTESQLLARRLETRY